MFLQNYQFPTMLLVGPIGRSNTRNC